MWVSGKHNYRHLYLLYPDGCKLWVVRVNFSENLTDFENKVWRTLLPSKKEFWLIPFCEVDLFTWYSNIIPKNFLYLCMTFLHWHRKLKNYEISDLALFAVFRCFMWCSSFHFTKVQKLFWVLIQWYGPFTHPTKGFFMWSCGNTRANLELNTILHGYKLLLAQKDLTECKDHISYTHNHPLIWYCPCHKCHRLIRGLQHD